MTLPLFQFRDRRGEVVNLSAVEDREVITKAELYHIIDVAEGVWCHQNAKRSGC